MNRRQASTVSSKQNKLADPGNRLNDEVQKRKLPKKEVLSNRVDKVPNAKSIPTKRTLNEREDVSSIGVKDVGEIPGLVVLRGGFNSGFDVVAHDGGHPIIIQISGDNLLGVSNDRRHFSLRLGRQVPMLSEESLGDETDETKIEWKRQMYNEEDIESLQ